MTDQKEQSVHCEPGELSKQCHSLEKKMDQILEKIKKREQKKDL